MTKHFVILAALFSSVLCGCNVDVVLDPGTPVDKDFLIAGGYDSVDISNSFDVFVDKDATAVTVTAGENIMSRVIVEQVGGELKIYCNPPVVSTSDAYLQAVIPHSTALKSVSVSGAGSFHSPRTITNNTVQVKLSGASSFSGSISANKTEVDLSGASRITGKITADDMKLGLNGASVADITGKAKNLELDFSGASRNEDNAALGKYGMECTNCKGSVSGASKAYIHCLNEIAVSLSGASSLHYTGDATTDKSSTSGASSIAHDRL
ncbi:MAG: DUF2807 domain-containing protein [Bacteroidales bacterium]|nr:DUF2807 domain-containing protein [Bacteroidales bacterium]